MMTSSQQHQHQHQQHHPMKRGLLQLRRRALITTNSTYNISTCCCSSHDTILIRQQYNSSMIGCCSILLILSVMITSQVATTTAFQTAALALPVCRIPTTRYQSLSTTTNNNNAESNEESNKVTNLQVGTAVTAVPTMIDNELEQQINYGLQRAKAVLEKSKAKMAAKQNQQQKIADDTTNRNDVATERQQLPFFASKVPVAVMKEVGSATTSATATTSTISATATIGTSETKIQQLEKNTNDVEKVTNRKVKSRDNDTGLIMCDGEIMAQISEAEPWEYRSIYEIFTNDNNDNNNNNNNVAATPPSENISTDVMASIQNLRKVLKTEDYRTIFDVRNRFIGEDN